MNIDHIEGKYVVAVSGGVDSVVLLDLLYKESQKSNKLNLIVAHFDHGIRKYSSKDRKFVQELATKYGIKFFFKEGHLGEQASENTARKARYLFLHSIVKKESADGLITAHHQDDLIETAILNIIRGTGRKGLTSLASSRELVRPLLSYPKSEIIAYAKKHNLDWLEDSTNLETKYLRNYIRHQIVPRLDKQSRQQLLKLITSQEEINKQIDTWLADILNTKVRKNSLSRLWLNSLDNSLSKEILAAWLRRNGLSYFNKATIERLATQLKTISPGKKVEVLNNWQIISSKDNLALKHVER